jgi:hypothetical protein
VDRRTRTGLRPYLVERRKGKVWMYGSVALCIALLAYLAVLLFR